LRGYVPYTVNYKLITGWKPLIDNDNDDFKELIDISETVDKLDDDIKFACFKRAVTKLDLDPDDIDLENEELEKAFGEELKIAGIENIFGRLHKEGLLEASGVDEKGEITYKLTDAGIQYCEENFSNER
jgi:hypothetical protein